MEKKGQSFQKYTEELKREVVRLRLEEGKSLREIREQLGVKSDATNCRVGKTSSTRGVI